MSADLDRLDSFGATCDADMIKGEVLLGLLTWLSSDAMTAFDDVSSSCLLAAVAVGGSALGALNVLDVTDTSTVAIVWAFVAVGSTDVRGSELVDSVLEEHLRYWHLYNRSFLSGSSYLRCVQLGLRSCHVR